MPLSEGCYCHSCLGTEQILRAIEGARVPVSLLTVSDAAIYLSLGKTTVYGLVNSGELAAFKVGSDYRIPRQELDDWIRSQLNAAEQGHHPAEERRAV